jgi:hypothetical protein
MAVFRVDTKDKNRLYKIELPPHITEDEFIQAQSKGKIPFIKLDENKDLPELPEIIQRYSKPYYMLDENSKPIFDVERIKKEVIKSIDENTQSYLDGYFVAIEYGRNENEGLAAVLHEENFIMGDLIRKLEDDLESQGKDPSKITLTTLWKKTTAYLAKKYTAEDAINELRQIGVSEQTLNEILNELKRLIWLATIELWDEITWRYSEQIIKQVEACDSIECLENILSSIKYPEKPPLEP